MWVARINRRLFHAPYMISSFLLRFYWCAMPGAIHDQQCREKEWVEVASNDPICFCFILWCLECWSLTLFVKSKFHSLFVEVKQGISFDGSGCKGKLCLFRAFRWSIKSKYTEKNISYHMKTLKLNKEHLEIVLTHLVDLCLCGSNLVPTESEGWTGKYWPELLAIPWKRLVWQKPDLKRTDQITLPYN